MRCVLSGSLYTAHAVAAVLLMLHINAQTHKHSPELPTTPTHTVPASLCLYLSLSLPVCRQGGLLGTAGAERNLYLCEPRKWRTVSKWHGATRLAIHSVSFLDCDPRCAVLAGLDLEVVVGRWDSPGSNARVFESGRKQDGDEAAAIAGAAGAAGGSRGQVDAAAAAAAGGSSLAPKHAAQGAHGSGDGSRRSGGQKAGAAGGGGGMDLDDGEGPSAASAGALTFRGDGRWLGVSKAVGADVLAGFAASGNLVYARLA